MSAEPGAPHEPQTPAEWQRVVNMAAGYLLLASARAYGLVTGGPVVHEARCRELLERGRRDGFVPRDREVDAFLELLIRGDVYGDAG